MYIEKLLGNLAYGVDTGRESVLECIKLIIKQFPEKLISHRASSFFTSLSATFAGDSSVKCRGQAAEVIIDLTERYSSQEYSVLILAFMENEDPEQKRLACLLICLLGDKLKQDFQIDKIVNNFQLLITEEMFPDADDALIISVLQGKHTI
jgi:hypothetical protein